MSSTSEDGFFKETNVASKAKMISSAGASKPESECAQATSREDVIRTRAYEIFLQRGGQHGYEIEDWLQAEREFGLS
jgi:Protein of unknown function (DUF2934)